MRRIFLATSLPSSLPALFDLLPPVAPPLPPPLPIHSSSSSYCFIFSSSSFCLSSISLPSQPVSFHLTATTSLPPPAGLACSPEPQQPLAVSVSTTTTTTVTAIARRLSKPMSASFSISPFHSRHNDDQRKKENTKKNI